MDHALVLAPFALVEMGRLSQSMSVAHENWLQTGRMYDPDELAKRINHGAITHLIIEADFLFAETLEQTPTLRFAGVCRNALNQVDVDAATRLGILVANTPGRNAIAVAELTLGMLLSLARSIPAAHDYVRGGQWDDPTGAYEIFRGTELAGKTAGIIGFGAIGRLVAKRLLTMDMRLLVFDPFLERGVCESLGAEPVSLETLLAASDYVLVHAPSTPSSLGMIGREQLVRMKPAAYLVNTSAPGVCDEAALIEALTVRRIAGAALDVFDGQPLPPSSKLLALDNVILTPHIGGATIETIQRYSKMIVEDIESVEANRPPRRLVNPAAWIHRRLASSC